jgi:putative nucleotidyltransferase-like protein
MRDARLPPFGTIQAALRRTTEHLASELLAPAARAPAWSEFEWAIARAAATMQGISVLLANRLRWAGPAEWRAFLEQERARSMVRDVRIGELLAGIDSATRKGSVGCVALKGSALRPLGLYQPGERPMGDVDLMVPAEHLGRLADTLRTLGYFEASAVERHVVFQPRDTSPVVGYGEHPDHTLKIEVHTRIAEPLPLRFVDISAGMLPVDLRPGVNAYRSTAALMQHLILHAAGNIRAHALRQIQLHDIAVLARRLSAREWSAVIGIEHREPGCWWTLPPLEFTARYYPDSVPADVLSAVRERCPRWLRVATARSTLTQVSWSNLRIAAFPGIAWSRSPLEALRFARSRLIPGKSALDELKIVQVAQPTLAQVPWYGRSHANRILRWVFTSPPRVQTMLSVRAALGVGQGR